MGLQHLSDQELFSLIDQGRDEAFSALLAKHYDTLFAFAFKYCRRHDNAEDIVQETLLKISRSFHLFDRRNLFTTWAYQIVINTAKDLFKKESRERDKQQAYAREADCHYSVADPSSDSIWALIEQLPKKLYDAVFLVYGQGFNHAEAAHALGCAETTISWRLHHARKKLIRQARHIGAVLIVLLFGGEKWTK